MQSLVNIIHVSPPLLALYGTGWHRYHFVGLTTFLHFVFLKCGYSAFLHRFDPALLDPARSVSARGVSTSNAVEGKKERKKEGKKERKKERKKGHRNDRFFCQK